MSNGQLAINMEWIQGVVQEVRINHGGHVEPSVRIPRSFGTKIFYPSVKLRVLRGENS